jgi:hypothetical protein
VYRQRTSVCGGCALSDVGRRDGMEMGTEAAGPSVASYFTTSVGCNHACGALSACVFARRGSHGRSARMRFAIAMRLDFWKAASIQGSSRSCSPR